MCFWHARWDTTIIMAVHNNNDILMIHYEDLPDGDKDVISKAIEEFQNKCLLSYTKTRDNTIIQKAAPASNCLDICQPKGLIKSVPAIKKQHQLVVVMSRQFRVHLNKLKELLQIRHSTILDHQYSMCNSRRGKVRTR